VNFPLETRTEGSENTAERLVAYFQSVDEGSSQEHLEYLLESVAKPIIHRIVQRSGRLSVSGGYESSVQDVVGETLLRVLTRMRASKSDSHQQVISNFTGLVATITYRAIADHLRAKNRQRTNLEKKDTSVVRGQ
jgi:DNA-directed RNA polymerase specialized sigma24 family protein